MDRASAWELFRGAASPGLGRNCSISCHTAVISPLKKSTYSTYYYLSPSAAANMGHDASIDEREKVSGNGTLSDPRLVTVSQVPNPPFNKLANPGPLGLFAFAVTTFVLGLYQCGAG